MKYFGFTLIFWWAFSFGIVALDYLSGRITKPWFFVGEIVNILTFIFIYNTLKNYNIPLSEPFIIIGFALILWFSHYMWVDYQSPYMSIELRILYGTIDLLTCLYICLILYRNMGLIARISKADIICSLEQIMMFARCIFMV